MPALVASKPRVSVVIDKPRDVRFTWSSINRFEESYGRSLMEAMSVNVGVRLVTHLVWAGLLHDEPSLTIREVERRIQAYINLGGDVNSLAEKVTGALVSSGVLGKVKTEPDPETPSEEPEGNAPEQAS